MYRDLVLVRAIDTVAISLQRQGELGIWASLHRPRISGRRA
jgi:2-oxoisovalerate dehydrogenase E1 component alpha subunit